jgi:hypothetical protein
MNTAYHENVAQVVQDMTSRDVDRIRKAGLAIIQHSQNEAYISQLIPYRDTIYQHTRKLDLRGALATNNRFYTFPITIIDHHTLLQKAANTANRCTCDLYLKTYQDFNPNEEARNNTITLVASAIGAYTWVYGITCEKCKRRFHVSERHYHYVWYKWDILSSDIPIARNQSAVEEALKLYVDILYTALQEPTQHADVKFHQENLRYYRNTLLQEADTKDVVTQSRWKVLLEEVFAAVENHTTPQG